MKAAPEGFNKVRAAQEKPTIFAYRDPPREGEFGLTSWQRITSLLGRIDRPVIVDLGPASSVTLETVSKYRCRFIVEDLYRQLVLLRENLNTVRFFRNVIPDLLISGKAGPRINLILCWDVLNYLEPPEIKVLLEHFLDYSVPDSKLLILVSTLVCMPVEPMLFGLGPEGEVRFRTLNKEVSPCPRYSLRDMEKLLKGYSFEHTCLHREGFYEVIARPRVAG